MKFIIPLKFKSKNRLDCVLSSLLPEYSRSQIKRWILCKKIKVNGEMVFVPKKKIAGGELVEIRDIEDCSMNDDEFIPQCIPLNVIYEDQHIIVINKSSNMVVHPGAGNKSGTILNALLYRYPSIITIPRAGIVQRLDKDTTGLMVVAKTIPAYDGLLNLFKTRQVIREYEAIVYGTFVSKSGTIEQPIRRHAVNRTCMTVHAMGKPAITHYYVIESFNSSYSRINVCLKTGRTHQIRVHMNYINHPLIGDQKYGKSINYTQKKVTFLDKLNKFYIDLRAFKRQALHACTLMLVHPIIKTKMVWNVTLPKDMLDLLNILRNSDRI